MHSTRKSISTLTIAKRRCSRCGRLVTFKRLVPLECFDCGKLVYPTRRMEVIENIRIAKLKKEMKKR